MPTTPEPRGPARVAVSLTVNGKNHDILIEPRTTLLDALRQELVLTGTKRVCNSGACGACTVLLDGEAIYSCMTLAITCEGHSVETIEGIAEPGTLHPIQEAFIEEDGYQCGFCTPGQVMAANSLLLKNPAPDIDEIKRGMSGNLCRCGAYQKIFRAVDRAASALAAGAAGGGSADAGSADAAAKGGA
ncbi:MAG: (2Fe-2S)-binding protein [Spirochaetota bacterium]